MLYQRRRQFRRRNPTDRRFLFGIGDPSDAVSGFRIQCFFCLFLGKIRRKRSVLLPSGRPTLNFSKNIKPNVKMHRTQYFHSNSEKRRIYQCARPHSVEYRTGPIHSLIPGVLQADEARQSTAPGVVAWIVWVIGLECSSVTDLNYFLCRFAQRIQVNSRNASELN
jgi:hypothetical protein